MSRNHTPGPWVLGFEDISPDMFVLAADGNTIVADCYSNAPDDLNIPQFLEATANARLISQAPHLLNLAELALRCLREDEYPELRQRLREAICAATGEDEDDL